MQPAPGDCFHEWAWCHSVDVAKTIIQIQEIENKPIELIDIDHDAGDYIKLLDWLEETGRNYPIHIHSMDVIGVENMRRIIERNG